MVSRITFSVSCLGVPLVGGGYLVGSYSPAWHTPLQTEMFTYECILFFIRKLASMCIIQCLENGICINPRISLPHQ